MRRSASRSGAAAPVLTSQQGFAILFTNCFERSYTAGASPGLGLHRNQRTMDVATIEHQHEGGDSWGKEKGVVTIRRCMRRASFALKALQTFETWGEFQRPMGDLFGVAVFFAVMCSIV